MLQLTSSLPFLQCPVPSPLLSEVLVVVNAAPVMGLALAGAAPRTAPIRAVRTMAMAIVTAEIRLIPLSFSRDPIPIGRNRARARFASREDSPFPLGLRRPLSRGRLVGRRY